MAKNWHNILFFAVILLACFLRLRGIYPSYPPYHSDEGMSYEQGISIIRENTLDAHGYSISLGYPFLIPVINAFLFKVVFIPLAWSKFFVTHLTQIVDGVIHLPFTQAEYLKVFQLDILGTREIYVLAWGRIIAAFFGVGIVVFSYFFSRQILGKYVGILTALLIAINYKEVLNSHLDLPDIYNAFF